jgi:hypothetical protein
VETLITTSRFNRGSLAPIHFVHAARTEERKDFIRAKFVADRKRHTQDIVEFIRSKGKLRLDDGVSGSWTAIERPGYNRTTVGVGW